MFGNTKRKIESNEYTLRRLIHRLIGSENEWCMNMPYATDNTIIGILRMEIERNTEKINLLQIELNNLKNPVKKKAGRPKKK